MSRKEAGRMSSEPNANVPSLDLIRWTFTCDAEHVAAIKDYLCDLGLDVLVYDECKFLVSWDEPEGDFEEIISEIWELNGTPFEVTLEEFHRLGLHTLHHVEDELGEQAA
jgi:hypothetical protein